jgi:rfaE bifunctional protein nucleotidyltransferase chain/domain
MATGALPSEAVATAVADASTFVANGGVGGLDRPGTSGAGQKVAGHTDALAVVARARARGETIVAAGGCFDVLHAGHVATLDAARALGNCLVVCLNSDASVRRLKGPGRPLVTQQHRATVLNALASVDAVAIFEDDTPAGILEKLRPDIFVKGGDYAGGPLPEADVLARWGGQAVVVPYVGRHSTSALAERLAPATRQRA